jgi:hypothetical protein
MNEMKNALKRLSLLLGINVVGVLLGTLASAPLNGVPLDFGSYFFAIIFSPIEQTLGIPTVFRFYSTLSGVLVVCGLVISIYCYAWSIARDNPRIYFVMLVGSTLWSLGNIPVYYAIMSV